MKLRMFFMSALALTTYTTHAQKQYAEPYRPQVHFSPEQKWINDPNGMVYYKGVYHLFFQYYPDSTVWGPMHWGHATSKDLIHWKQQPVALFPDSLGYIFSGSAVVDKNNTTGFGKKGKPALVAIFTHHDPKGEAAKTSTFQNQSLAYSLDDGATWQKYAGNPVLKNPGITDFRDPKVMWYEPQKKWVMTLATKDRVTFYSSKNLKEWKKESEFGATAGAHGGVWECPDLFTLDYKSKKIWILTVSINPGGPNGGSATQYFTGSFNGTAFTPHREQTKWIDYGPDDYAGVTWNNTGKRKLFIGWMSNWLYANVVPTDNWRNAMTLPRELALQEMGNDMYITSLPVKELATIGYQQVSKENVMVKQKLDVQSLISKSIITPFRLDLSVTDKNDFSLVFTNDLKETLTVGYDKKMNSYFIDRTLAGKSNFYNGFAARHTAPRISDSTNIHLSLIVDESSIELFADNGLSVMTEIFFPGKPFNHVSLETNEHVLFKKLQFTSLKSIWR